MWISRPAISAAERQVTRLKQQTDSATPLATAITSTSSKQAKQTERTQQIQQRRGRRRCDRRSSCKARTRGAHRSAARRRRRIRTGQSTDNRSTKAGRRRGRRSRRSRRVVPQTRGLAVDDERRHAAARLQRNGRVGQPGADGHGRAGLERLAVDDEVGLRVEGDGGAAGGRGEKG
ncbi:hypothetical protein BKA80DRAFT_279675 [Phyllosticta citrichinensis]